MIISKYEHQKVFGTVISNLGLAAHYGSLEMSPIIEYSVFLLNVFRLSEFF
jgi:hypothetical protein